MSSRCRRRGDRADQQVQGALGSPSSSAVKLAVDRVRVLEAHARLEPVGPEAVATLPRSAWASSRSPRRRSSRRAGRRRRRAGLELERAAQRRLVAGGDQRVGLVGTRRRRSARPGRAAGRRRTRRPPAVPERLDRRDALDAERRAISLVGVGVELGQHDLALARLRGALEDRAEHPARPAPLGPEVDDDGVSRERSITSRSKSCSVTSMTAMPAMIGLRCGLSVPRRARAPRSCCCTA